MGANSGAGYLHRAVIVARGIVTLAEEDTSTVALAKQAHNRVVLWVLVAWTRHWPLREHTRLTRAGPAPHQASKGAQYSLVVSQWH